MIHSVVVHAANVQDPAGAKLVLDPLVGQMPRMQRLWADGIYAQVADWVTEKTGWQLEIVSRPAAATGFVLLPKRWVVERTFAWLGKCRRLSKDYEHLVASSEAMIHLAMIGLMTRRLRPT
jgi:putative transposase